MPLRESIYTIPINDLFSNKCGCPLCRAKVEAEKRIADFILGPAMMEPDIRMETNRLGFCKEHLTYLSNHKNRLSLALMLQSRIKEINRDAAKPKALKAKLGHCFICEKLEVAEKKNAESIVRTFSENRDFRTLFSEAEGLCFPHFAALLSAAEKCGGKAKKEFTKAATEVFHKKAQKIESDIDGFCAMFDYRNNTEGNDFGELKNAVENASDFLSANCKEF